ncbi:MULTISPECIES: zinc ribbon domain-containing protein [Clostridium]|uniref:Zinc ribbon domain-containing protein n=1 Tax=Clostridium cibarium TaxID=2762247 RepID=A0ABR8PT06_9CLOT|nr:MULTISPECIES: zinc ribbon domain-containing protein [Clostridium]MBD7911244.1 zinc ribbon domain-containing protein [Clostridium cibarium]
MFCKNCGKEIDDKASVCIHCGVSTNLNPTVVDNGGFAWGLLGCCVPVVGLVLFLVWKDTKPRTSKAAGIGALVSVICIIVFYVLMFMLGAAGAMSGL